MESMEFNKIAGAVLGALLFGVGLNVLAEGIFSNEAPAKAGYVVKVADAKATTETEAAVVAPIAERLKTATAAAGEKVFANCKGCHNAEENGPNGQGPNLWNVIGGPSAHMKTFTYSSGMMDRAKAGGMWTYDDLDKFLTNPKAYVEGTKMSFAGLKKPDDRANVIMYLRSKANPQQPLPN